MPGTSFFRYLVFLLGSSLCATACFSCVQRIDGTTESQSFEIYFSSIVVSDPGNSINIDGGTGILGPYKYSLDGSLSPPPLRGVEREARKTVVKDLVTGKIGLTEGKLIIKHITGVNADDIASDYGLEVVDYLPSINRIVVQLPDLLGLANVQNSLRVDQRILETSLEVYYGGYQLR